MRKHIHFIYALFGLFITIQGGLAAEYHPEVLGRLIRNVRTATQHGIHPVVVFDLDDTLINTRERNVRILHDFASLDSTRETFPEESEIAANLSTSQFHYLLKDTLSAVGITNKKFIEAASAFWLQNFFTNKYCADDIPNDSAASYVRALARAGATIVYLTGRDLPRMGNGTVKNLLDLHFPLGTKRARLIMKPSKDSDDLQFKISQFDRIRETGPVVAAFENEPANINAFQAHFPDSEMIFLDTIHSPKPDQPNDGVIWVKDFRPAPGN